MLRIAFDLNNLPKNSDVFSVIQAFRERGFAVTLIGRKTMPLELIEQTGIPTEEVITTDDPIVALLTRETYIYVTADQDVLKALERRHLPILTIDSSQEVIEDQIRAALHKETLLRLYRLTFKEGWAVDDKDNWMVEEREGMKRWKVFTVQDYRTKPPLWLTFRYHKLCSAKYKYFSENIERYEAAYDMYTADQVQYKGIDAPYLSGLKNKDTGRIVGITTLQQIGDIELFNKLVYWLEDK